MPTTAGLRLKRDNEPPGRSRALAHVVHAPPPAHSQHAEASRFPVAAAATPAGWVALAPRTDAPRSDSPRTAVIPAPASTPDGRHELIDVRLLAALPQHRLANRTFAQRLGDERPLLVYRIGNWTTLADAQRFLDLTFDLRHLRSRHICPILHTAVASDGGCWLVCPWPGHAGSLITLRDALAARPDGRLGPHEARSAIEHILEATRAGHRHGILHGPLDLDDLLINPRGEVAVELYGLEACLRPAPQAGDAEQLRHAELASIARLAYRLLTGSHWPPRTDRPARLRARLLHEVADRRWRRWLLRALALGPLPPFACADEALLALRSTDRAPFFHGAIFGSSVRAVRRGVARSARRTALGARRELRRLRGPRLN